MTRPTRTPGSPPILWSVSLLAGAALLVPFAATPVTADDDRSAHAAARADGSWWHCHRAHPDAQGERDDQSDERLPEDDAETPHPDRTGDPDEEASDDEAWGGEIRDDGDPGGDAADVADHRGHRRWRWPWDRCDDRPHEDDEGDENDVQESDPGDGKEPEDDDRDDQDHEDDDAAPDDETEPDPVDGAPPADAVGITPAPGLAMSQADEPPDPPATTVTTSGTSRVSDDEPAATAPSTPPPASADDAPPPGPAGSPEALPPTPEDDRTPEASAEGDLELAGPVATDPNAGLRTPENDSRGLVGALRMTDDPVVLPIAVALIVAVGLLVHSRIDPGPDRARTGRSWRGRRFE